MIRIEDLVHSNASFEAEDGRWLPACPEPFYSFWFRLRDAWAVFRYRAEAVTWPKHRQNGGAPRDRPRPKPRPGAPRRTHAGPLPEEDRSAAELLDEEIEAEGGL